MITKIWSLFRSSAAPPSPPAVIPGDGTPFAPACDNAGIIWTRLATGAGGSGVTGGAVNADALPTTDIGEDVRSFLYGFNSATWDRLRTLADNGDAQAALTLGLLATMARLEGFNGATFDRLRSVADNADAQAALTLGLLATMARQQQWNGATWDRVRTPNVFKTASFALAGNTAVWTPAAGKKFRLMGYVIEIPADVVTGTGLEITVQFFDAAAAMPIAYNPFIPATAGAQGIDRLLAHNNIGNGFLSSAINNTLNINLSLGFSGSGNGRVNVWGTEE